MGVFRVRHPREPAHADCGYDPTGRGFFVELTSDGLPISYDAASPGVYDDDTPLVGALVFLAAFGFLGDIESALACSGGVQIAACLAPASV